MMCLWRQFTPNSDSVFQETLWNTDKLTWMQIDEIVKWYWLLTTWMCHSRKLSSCSFLSSRISDCHRNIMCLGLLSGGPENNRLIISEPIMGPKEPQTADHSLDSFQVCHCHAKVYDDVNPMCLGKVTRSSYTYKHKGSKHYRPW